MPSKSGAFPELRPPEIHAEWWFPTFCPLPERPAPQDRSCVSKNNLQLVPHGMRSIPSVTHDMAGKYKTIRHARLKESEHMRKP
jgi:hypothetical protein